MSNLQVSKLHLWTSGDRTAGIAGEAAEITAPSWLINSADYDPTEFKAVLEDFRSKILEAFSVDRKSTRLNSSH